MAIKVPFEARFSAIEPRAHLGGPSSLEIFDLLAQNLQAEVHTLVYPENCQFLSARHLRCLGPQLPTFEEAVKLESPIRYLFIEGLQEGLEASFKSPWLFLERKSWLEFTLKSHNATLIELLAQLDLRCGLRAHGALIHFGSTLRHGSGMYGCSFDGLGQELAGPVEIFLSPDGDQKILLRGSEVLVVATPMLGSIDPSWIVAPLPGRLLELKGTGLGFVESVKLEARSGPVWQSVPYIHRTDTRLTFAWPSGGALLRTGEQLSVSATSEFGFSSNLLPITVGAVLEIVMSNQPVGFKNLDLIVQFSLSQARGALNIDCIAESGGEITVVVKAEAAGDDGESCELSCAFPSHRLQPGTIKISLEIEREPEWRALGFATLLDIRSGDTRLERRRVFSSHTLFQLAVELRQPVSNFFSAHVGAKMLEDGRELWCVYTGTSFTANKRVLATISKDQGYIWCGDVPREAGSYRVALSYDGFNLLEIPGAFRVLSIGDVSVTDVGPRLIPIKDKVSSLQPLTVQLHGHGLDLLEPELIAVTLDQEAVPTSDVKLEAEEHLLTLRLPRHPQHMLQVRLLARQDGPEELAEVSVRTVAQPSVGPQALQVYPGEDIRLSGQNLADQLDLSCILDKVQANATVLDATSLLCPGSLLVTRPGQSLEGLRAIQVRSSSLQELVSPGLHERVGVESVPPPSVSSMSRVAWSTDPALCCSSENLTLTMASQVLERDIRIKYGDKEPHPCTVKLGFKVVCSGPFGLEPAGVYPLSIQFFPGSPFVAVGRAITGVAWPLLRDLHPKVLISALTGQTITVTGEHFTAAQKIIQGLSLSTGHRLLFKTINDTALLVEDLPALGSAPGELRRISITLNLTEPPESAPLDLLVVDQPLIRAYSPVFAVHDDEPTQVLIETHGLLYEFVPYWCFLKDGDGRDLQPAQASLIGLQLLECPILATVGPGCYKLGISVRPDVAPASYEDLFLLPEPKLSRIEGVGAYVHNNEEIDLELYGVWEWYEDLPAPLIILTDHISGELVEILPGSYDPAADKQKIKFTLPRIGTQHKGLIVEVSQTGALSSAPHRTRLGISLISRPELLDISPRVIDSRASGHVWVTVKGAGFFKDGGLPEDRTNIYCAIDGVRSEIVYHNKTQIECLLRLETDVLTYDHSYEVSVSVNYGFQWVNAPEQAVRTIVLPEIASIFPGKISSNLVSRIEVQLTRSAQSPPTLSLEGFEVLSQEDQGSDLLALLVQPNQRPTPPEGSILISLSLPQVRYHSLYSELQVVGGTSLTGNSPRTVLAFQSWAELALTGSHLDLQPLYCQIGERLYEFVFGSDHDGTCHVALHSDSRISSVLLVTALGETVPGTGEIEVIPGSARALWPQLSYVASVTRNTVLLTGSGFVSGSSRCHIRGQAIEFVVEANVTGPSTLTCRFPQGHTLPEVGPVVQFQIQNYFDEDLASFLWSQALSLETEAPLWTLEEPLASFNFSATQNPYPVSQNPAKMSSILEALGDEVPPVLLDGVESAVSLDLDAIRMRANASVSACEFRQKRSNGNAGYASDPCLLWPSWSSVFQEDNAVRVSVLAEGVEIVLSRTVPILRRLEIQYSQPLVEKGEHQLELYLSAGSGTAEWLAIGDGNLPIVFTCTPVFLTPNSAVPLAELEGPQPGAATPGQVPGHFIVRCPYDWRREGLTLNLTYEIAGQSVTLGAPTTAFPRFSVSATLKGGSSILLGPLMGNGWGNDLGRLFCRVEWGLKGPFYSMLVPDGQWATCSLPLWNLDQAETKVRPQVVVVLVPDLETSTVIVVSWPSEFSTSGLSKGAQNLIAQSPSVFDSLALPKPSPRALSINPTLILAEECLAGNMEDSRPVEIQGAAFGPSTTIWARRLPAGELKHLECDLRSGGTSTCRVHALVCQAIEAPDFFKEGRPEFEILATESNLGESAQEAEANEHPVVLRVSDRLSGLKCQNHSGQAALGTGWSFDGPTELLSAIPAAGRWLLCVYSEGGDSYVGPLGEQEPLLYYCPPLLGQAAKQVDEKPQAVSIVAGGASGGYVNLTVKACLPEQDPMVSMPALLAWLQPPGAPCGTPSRHLLMVKGVLPEGDSFWLTHAQIYTDSRRVAGEGSQQLSTYDVTLEVPCRLGNQNLTSTVLDLQSNSREGLARAHYLTFRPFKLLKVSWSADESTTSQGTGGLLSLMVDRPWDLFILVGSGASGISCDFGEAGESEAREQNGAVVCAAPFSPGDLSVSLTLSGGGKANPITASPFTLNRGATKTGGGTVVEKKEIPGLVPVRLLSPRDVVYGQQEAVVLVLEVEGSEGISEDARCLVRARGLPILALEAKRLSTGILGDGMQFQYFCILDEASQARLEKAGIHSIEVGLGNRDEAVPKGSWPSLPLRRRVTIDSVQPQRLVLHPKKRHEVVLQGDFQTMVEAARTRAGLRPLWVRLRGDGADKLFPIEEVRSDEMSFWVPGESVGAGASLELTVGDVPPGSTDSRVLASSLKPLRVISWLPIEDFKPKVVLMPAPKSFEVTLSVLKEPEFPSSEILCVERKIGFPDALTWSSSRSLSSRNFSCQIESGRAGTRQIGLGVRSGGQSAFQLLTEFVDLELIPFELSSLLPSSGLASGGQVVRISGSGFASLITRGGGFACKFGLYNVQTLAHLVSDQELECVTPASAPQQVNVYLLPLDSQNHMITQDRRASKALSYTFFSLPTVASIFPSSISTVIETRFDLTVQLKAPLPWFQGQEVVCRLVPTGAESGLGPSSEAQAELLDPSVLTCPFVPFDWQAGHRYCALQLSLNGGLDFGTVYGPIHVIEPPRAHGAGSFAPSLSSKAVTVTVPLTNNSEMSSALGCLASNEDKQTWFFPASQRNETHALCYDGLGLLAKGGQVQVLDASLGLLGPQINLNLAVSEQEMVLAFDDSNKTTQAQISPIETNLTNQKQVQEVIQTSQDALSGSPAIMSFKQLHMLTILEDGATDKLPSLSLEGRGLGAGEQYNIRLETLEPQWNEQRWNYSTRATAASEQALRIELGKSPELLQWLRSTYGGLFYVFVEEAQADLLPILVLSRPKILNVTATMPTARAFRDDADGLASFLTIVGENLPASGELNVWCAFIAVDNNTNVGTREVLVEAWLSEEVTISRQSRTRVSTLGCELPASVVAGPTSDFLTDAGEDRIPGRLVFGAWGKQAVQDPLRPSALDFSVALARRWSVSRMELRGSRLYIFGHHFPAGGGGLVCLIEASGQRLSRAVGVSSRELYCPIQSFSGTAQVRLRDLGSGESSGIHSLSRLLPTFNTVIPQELYFSLIDAKAIPEVHALGADFTPDCQCLLNSQELLGTTFLNSSALHCDIESSASLDFGATTGTNSSSWSVAVSCPKVAWVSHQVALQLRNSTILFSAADSDITESALLEGFDRITLEGQQLHPGLLCHQALPGEPDLQYQSPLTNVDADNRTAECRVEAGLFEHAPITGRTAELWISGQHVQERAINVTYFPRLELSIKEGADALYRDTEGQEVQLYANRALGQLSKLTSLTCLFRPDSGFADQWLPEPLALNVSYSSKPILIAGSSFQCPLPRTKDPELTYLWLTLRIERLGPSGFVDHSAPVRVTLFNPPRIVAIAPTVLPAGPATTDHIVRLVVHDGLDPEVHALRVGDADTLTELQRDDGDGSLFFLAPESKAGFYRLVVYLLVDWQIGQGHDRSDNIWS